MNNEIRRIEAVANELNALKSAVYIHFLST